MVNSPVDPILLIQLKQTLIFSSNIRAKYSKAEAAVALGKTIVGESTEQNYQVILSMFFIIFWYFFYLNKDYKNRLEN